MTRLVRVSLPLICLMSLLSGVARAQDGVDVEDSVIAPPPADFKGPPSSIPRPPESPDAIETICDDGIDNDNDGMIDCADADCYEHEACRSAGGLEATEALCRDNIDNDNDGYTDCDDVDCHRPGLTACQGSWKAPVGAATPEAVPYVEDEFPELGPGMSVEDLIGRGSDKDGERNDVLCSDGIDNDGDGAIDCEDIGCRFDPNVTVCRGVPGLRFSVVAHVMQNYRVDRNDGSLLGDVSDLRDKAELDTRFSVLQLRAFGPIPGLQDSFFLLSIRAERSPRLTFAMAQFPIGRGHFINVNSGGGGLSNALVLSAAKRALVDPPLYVYGAFEQGNGAAIEVNGPIWPGWVDYRVFVAGGAGLFNGNVGGRFFTFENLNYTYTAGAQLIFSPIGYYNRWDTAYLYTSLPATLGFTLGAKYDQRAQERYPAINAAMVFRWSRFLFMAENYTKRELEFGSWQTAYNIMGGFLLWPKYLYLAADFGQFYSTELENPPEIFQTELRRQRPEVMWRAAAHWYVWRNMGVLSAVISDRYLGAGTADPNAPAQNIREAKLVAQFRF